MANLETYGALPVIDDWNASGGEAAGFVMPEGMVLVVPGTAAGTFPAGKVPHGRSPSPASD
ncbi:MAG: hypothetical protein ABR923_15900 [Terracidiphilus sp.]|jgi:hypothetical protein